MFDKLKCAFGFHRYRATDTKCTQVMGDTVRIEYTCCVCGKHNCFLTSFKALDAYAEDVHRRMNDEHD